MCSVASTERVNISGRVHNSKLKGGNNRDKTTQVAKDKIKHHKF